MTLGAKRNEVRGQMAPSNGARAPAMGSASCPPPPPVVQGLGADKRKRHLLAKFETIKKTQ